jgi:transposase
MLSVWSVAERKRYPSDLTDAQWELIEPLVPAPGSGGRPAMHQRRRIVEAILYVNRTGCSWRQLPHDFPPWATVFWYFKTWRECGVVDRLHDALRNRVRDAEGRDPMVSAGCVDAQSVKGGDTVGAAVRGFDAGKKVNGRKRHIVVDTMGLLVLVMITSAGVQDRDGARRLQETVKMVMPSLSLLWADGGYAGKLVEWAERVVHITVEIVRKPLGIKTFQVLPRRWVVERTFAWIVKCRRLDHDYERLPETSEAMIKWAMIGLMIRRLEPALGRRPWQKTSTTA